MAVGLGANVTILDLNQERLDELNVLFSGKVKCILSNEKYI